MIKIAVAEDEIEMSNQLLKYIKQFFDENDLDYSVMVFDNAIKLLDNYDFSFDLIFMDINMPLLNGVEASKKLREIDSEVTLIFITSLAQYAIKGYEVNAFDFILKPISYNSFSLKLRRVIDYFKKNNDTYLLIKNKVTATKIKTSDIKYIEVINHSLIYHTLNGDLAATGSLKKVKDELTDLPFEFCNQCYLVNLKYVEKIEDFTVYVDGTKLQISHPRHKAFLHALNNYLRSSMARGEH